MLKSSFGFTMMIIAATASYSAVAGPSDSLVEGYLSDLEKLQDAIIEQDDLLTLITASNTGNDDLDEDTILALDRRWIDGDEDFRDTVMSNALTLYLKERVDESGGRIGEIIIMDDKGLTVAAWPATSDYLQGDEDKYLETYSRGSDEIHIARVDFDESTGLFQQQISETLRLRGRRIGAITVGLNIAYSPPR